jgi:hypothetical protein
MTAMVLSRHPQLTVGELIARLDKEISLEDHENAGTGKVYARRNDLVHTQPDLSTARPIT